MSKPVSVVHISSAHPYTDNRVHYRECSSLVKAGYEVTLIAVESPVEGSKSEVKVITLPKRKRISRMLVSSFSAALAAFRSQAKIVHMHDPELIPYIPILRLAGRFVIYDAHEDLPVQIINKPYLKRPTATVLSALSRALVRMAHMSNLVVCATESIALRYPASKTIVVHNYPPLREIEAETASLEPRARQERIVYVGGLSIGRGAETMVDALAEPTIPEGWRLRMAGTGSESLLTQLKDRQGWQRVDFDGQVPPDAARDIIISSRVGLVLFADTLAHRDSLPTKMFEYFAAGVPVIASNFPLWRAIVEEHDCGLLVSPDSPAEVADAIRQYADQPELLQRHSHNARNLAVTRLNWSLEEKVLIDGYAKHLK